jgi:hypothetical protein
LTWRFVGPDLPIDRPAGAGFLFNEIAPRVNFCVDEGRAIQPTAPQRRCFLLGPASMWASARHASRASSRPSNPANPVSRVPRSNRGQHPLGMQRTP